jgi:hypothetical protein
MRRAIAITAATIAGMAASVAFAAPVAAESNQDPVITVVAEEISCKVNGTVQVLWEITNDLGFDIKLTAAEFTPAGSTSTFVPNTVLADTDALLVAQFVPSGTNAATAKFSWENATGGDPADVSGQTEVVLECPKLVDAEFTDNCDGTVTVKLINLDPQSGVSFTVNGVQEIVSPGGTKTIDNVTPDAGGNVEVTVNTLPVGSHHWTKPSDCPLPETGTSVGGLVALGVALVGAGAALAALAVRLRRRSRAAT